MSLMAGMAIYGVIWWTVLFAVLPFGIVSQHEGEDAAPGTDPGAPIRTGLLRKVGITTIIAAFVWLFVAWIWIYEPISFDDIPFLPKLHDWY